MKHKIFTPLFLTTLIYIHAFAQPTIKKQIAAVQTSSNAMLTLTDQTGKALFTKTINGEGKINIANLGAGLCYLKNNATGAESDCDATS